MIAIVPPDIKISSLSLWKNLHFQALRTIVQQGMGLERSEKQAKLWLSGVSPELIQVGHLAWCSNCVPKKSSCGNF